MRKIVALFFSFVAIGMLLCACDNVEAPGGKIIPASIDVLKIGKADCIIINTGNKIVMIDTGEEENIDQIRDFMDEHNYNKVDTLILTHYDKDHIGGAKYIIEEYGVDTVIESRASSSSAEYYNYHQFLSQQGKEPTKLKEDYTFKSDSCVFKVNVPKKDKYDKKNDNNLSLVISMECGNSKFLFCGDALELRLAEILEPMQGEYDVIKLPHHGSYNEAYSEFFGKIKTENAIITDSKKNPAEERTLSLLAELGIEAYETRYGSLHIYTDGQDVTIN